MVVAATECVRGCQVAVDDGRTVFVAAAATGGSKLCDSCLGRIGWLLDDCADIAARARLAVVPGLGASTDGSERVSGSKDPGLPLNVAAMDACDLVVGVVAEWVTFWAETLHARPPEALKAALAADRNVAGVRAGTDADAVAAGLLEWGAWLKLRLPAIARWDAAGEFLDGLRVVVARVGAQFPRDTERVVEQRPRFCPTGCVEPRVWVSWPMRGTDPEVKCGGCDWLFETDWKEFLHAVGVS
ncbi:hypothetical protein ACXR2W_00895 [Leucobacter sp. HY1908]